MKIYRSGENLIVDKSTPFQPVYINVIDVVILEWGEGSIGIHSNESQRTYRDDWSLITDENGVAYGSDFQETIEAVRKLLIDILAQTEGEENRLFNYVALNYANLQSIATSPAEGDIAYVKQDQGTKWLPWSLGGTYYPTGLYYYDGVKWISDKEAVAEQLQVNIEDIDDLESEVQSNDADITALQSGLTTEISNRTNADTNLQNQINSNSFKVKIDSSDVTGQFLEDKLLNGPEIKFGKTIGATKQIIASVETNGLDNSKFKQVPTNTLKGRSSALTGNVEDLTIAQVKTMLGILSETWKPSNVSFGELISAGTSGASLAQNNGAGVYYDFPNFSNDEVHIIVSLERNGLVYDGSNIIVELLWMRYLGNNNNIVWELDYHFSSLGDDAYDAPGNTITLTEIISISTIPNQELQSLKFDAISGAIGSKILQLTLRRPSSNGSDNYSGAGELYGLNLLKQ